MYRGYIKLYRKLTEWEWYKDIPVRILFEHCLFKANLTDKNWKGIVIKQGSFVTSLDNLSFETGLSKMQVRTAINKLKLTREITYETTTQYSIITVNNWIEYQSNNTQLDTPITHEQHTNNTQITLTKEYKNNKNEKNILYIDKKVKKFQKPTIEEIKEYILEGNYTSVNANHFYDYYESNGWIVGKNKMKDWKATIRNWHRRNIEKDKQEETPFDYENAPYNPYR